MMNVQLILNISALFTSAVIIVICLSSAHHSNRMTSISIMLAYLCIFAGSCRTWLEFFSDTLHVQESDVLVQIGVAVLLTISRRRADKGYPAGHMMPNERRRRIESPPNNPTVVT